MFYRDFDGDGFGHDDYNLTTCTAPERYTEVAGDCDDDDANTFPDAPEQCDEIDNDCDGEVDQAWLAEDFEGDTDRLTASGDLSTAEDDDGGYLLLTDDTDQVSALFFDELIASEAWAISATVSMDDGEGNGAGVGGITFAFLTETDPSVIGSDLGVSGLSGYAVELDIHEDDSDDPDSNHIAFIETDTMTSLATITDIPTMEGAGEIVVTVTVRDDTLTVSLDGSVVMQEALDSALSGDVLLGITASSGDPAAIQTLDDLTISCP